VPDDILVDKEIATRKSINWKYVALVVSILGAFFLMIKAVSVPVEPIIIMNEPAIAHLAAAPENSEETETQSPPSDSTSNPLLLPNERLETLPPVATVSAEGLVAKDTEAAENVVNTDIASVDKSQQELTDIELAKKKAKQKAKKKSEEAVQQSQTETKPQVETPPQQSIVVLQKEPAVVAEEAKKDSPKEFAKEAVKSPVQEKSPWSVFADSIVKGGETPCTPAQIAMNQCS
jgi:hypothetical protein